MLAQQTKHALGSTALLTVTTTKETTADHLLERLWRSIDDFEARFSRFQATSELIRFNQQAGQLVAVSPELHELLKVSKKFSEETDGLYNPFILPALQQAGYVGSWPTPSHAEPQLDYSNRRLHPIIELHIEAGKARIPADSAIDFGGIGKGFLLDQLAELAAGKCDGFWFSLGGDIVAEGFDTSGKPWRLSVQAAENPAMTVATIDNAGGQRLALATSGVTKRGGKKGERNWHHLIDPRTGLSAKSDILTASVAAASATAADINASCAVLLGSAKAEPWLEERQCAGLLQTTFATPFSQNLLKVGNSFKLEVRRVQ